MTSPTQQSLDQQASDGAAIPDPGTTTKKTAGRKATRKSADPATTAKPTTASATAHAAIQDAIDEMEAPDIDETGWPTDVSGLQDFLRVVLTTNAEELIKHEETTVQLTRALRIADKVGAAEQALKNVAAVTESRLKPLSGFDLGENCTLHGGDMNQRSRSVQNSCVLIVSLNAAGEATALLPVPRARMSDAGNGFFDVVPHY